MRSESGNLRAVSLVTAVALALSALGCGEKFTSANEEPSSGSGGMSTAGKAGGEEGGSDDGGRGGMPSGGKASGGFAGDVAVSGGPALGGMPSLGGNGGMGGGPVVEPPAVPQDGLELWFRVDYGAMADDGAVSVWKDGSPHARDALQTALNYRPRLQAQAIGGHPALSFDGVDDYFRLPALDIELSSGVSIFLVFQREIDGYCTGYFEASNGSEIDDVHFGEWNNSLNYEVGSEYLNDTNYALSLGGAQLVVAIQRANQQVQLRSNSNGAGENSINLPPPRVVRQEAFIGNTLYECPPFHGYIGELLVYGRAVSDQEVLDIEGYLQGKWDCCSE